MTAGGATPGGAAAAVAARTSSILDEVLPAPPSTNAGDTLDDLLAGATFKSGGGELTPLDEGTPWSHPSGIRWQVRAMDGLDVVRDRRGAVLGGAIILAGVIYFAVCGQLNQ